MSTIGFIGSGNMAEALIKGITTARLYEPANIFISDIRPERLDFLAKQYGVQKADSNAVLVEKVDIVVLSIKPQNMTDALESIKGAVSNKKLVISIAAGVKTSRIGGVLGDVAIVRAMPNTPAMIGEGASALFANTKAKQILKQAEAIFSAVGQVVTVDNEDLIDAVTAISGSGPAYYFLFMEKMIKAAVELGLPEDVAKSLVLQTAKGAALLTVEGNKNNEDVSKLRQKVTSPGGTTEAALKVFEDKHIDTIIADATEAAFKRSQELSG
ncbi:MAG: pyrroline-5-carboxylate reductase [Sedimentisphaerales bacterium]|nr:pyrroline-5-carboxylate reductase [Sedimentisphaerales bacterium]